MNAISLSICSKSIRTFDGLFCLNDLHKASGNKATHKPANFLRNQQTVDLVELLKFEKLEPIQLFAGTKGGTYVCIELVYAYAMWISPAFYLTVIRTIMAMNEPAKIEPPKQQALPLLPMPFQQGRYLIEVTEDSTKIIDASGYELVKADIFQKFQQGWKDINDKMQHFIVSPSVIHMTMHTSDEYRHQAMPVLGEFVTVKK